jgi:hypothetical protein
VTSPRHAHETDNGRYYTIPGLPPLVSITNAISVGLSKYALPIWYANQSTEAAWDVVPGMVAALRAKPCGIRPPVWPETEPAPCGICRDCLTRHIKEAAERARDSASFLGSRVHELAEAHVLGRTLAPLEGDDEAGLFVAQYLKFLKDFDVNLDRDVVSAETTVVNERDGYAGTGDIWLRLPFDGFLFERDKAGQLVVKVKRVENPAERGTILVDLKTSRKRASTQSFPENVMQLAALRHATEIVLPDDTRAPNVRVTGAATLQLRPNRYSLIPLPSGQREYRLFQNVLALAEWLHNEWAGDYWNRPITPSGRFVAKRNQKTQPAEQDS